MTNETAAREATLARFKASRPHLRGHGLSFADLDLIEAALSPAAPVDAPNDVEALRALSRLLEGKEMTGQDRADVLTVRSAIHNKTPVQTLSAPQAAPVEGLDQAGPLGALDMIFSIFASHCENMDVDMPDDEDEALLEGCKAEIRAALHATPKPDVWLPIETAPKDGTEIWACFCNDYGYQKEPTIYGPWTVAWDGKKWRSSWDGSEVICCIVTSPNSCSSVM